MNKILIVAAGLIVALVVACSAAPTITTKTPTATAVPPPDTPTPAPVPEWALEDITVRDDTVIVSIFLFSTAAVKVTLDGQTSTRIEDNLPVLGYIFEEVPHGEHPIEIRDVMGNVETTSVVVDFESPDDSSPPEWLSQWLADLQARAVENPPQSITKYERQGEIVYYVVKQCCDQFSDLLDADGNLIGHPDGGITGRGDGVTVFDPSGQKGEEIWLGR